MTRRVWKGLVLALLSLVPCLALAATAGSQEAISTVVESLINGPLNMVSSAPFAAAGAKLLSMLLLILISWKGIRLVIDTSSINQVVAEIVNIVILWGIASFFLLSSVQTQIAEGFDQLAQTAAQSAGSAVGGASADVSSTQSMITGALVSGLTAAYQLYQGTPAEKPSSVSDSTWDKVSGWFKDKVNDLVTFQWLAAVANLIFRVFIAIMIMAAVVLYCGQLLISQVLVNVGLIMAPLLIPWIMWEASAFLFHSWIKFMIVAGIQKIVGALLFGMTTSFISELTSLTSSVNTDSSTNFYYYAAAFVLMFILGQLMMQISSIANGLVTGMPSTAFRAPSAMTPAGAAAGRAFGGSNVSQGARGAIGGGATGYSAAKAAGKGAMGSAMGAARGAASGMARGLRTTTGPLPRTSSGGNAPQRPTGSQTGATVRGSSGMSYRPTGGSGSKKG